MQIENFLPQPYSSCFFFFRSFKSNLVDPFFSNTQTFPSEVKCFIFPGGFKQLSKFLGNFSVVLWRKLFLCFNFPLSVTFRPLSFLPLESSTTEPAIGTLFYTMLNMLNLFFTKESLSEDHSDSGVETCNNSQGNDDFLQNFSFKFYSGN